jgi:2-oxoglutarate dehydrogenase E2 component (dihydrolipoamide succinyltransferase)
MKIDIKVPAVGESISEVTISQWLKKTGDYVELDDILCEIESDKATFELNAENAGILEVIVAEGETIEINTLIARIDTAAEGKSPTPASEKDSSTVSEASVLSVESKSIESSSSYATGHPSPAAAKILSEKGIQPNQVAGTGIDGRITKQDAIDASAPAASKVEKEIVASSSFSTQIGERNTRREKMTSLRKTIAKRLVEVKNNTAMLTTFNEVDMQPVMEMRKKYKDIFKEKHQIGLGFMSIFTKAVTEALKDFPGVNAQIDGTEIVYHDFSDIGIAVSTPKGLVVPVVRNAEKMNLAQIEKAIAELALKARDGKLTIEEMTGGTFTITNGGIFGSMLSTPIINAPQSAILGMHNIVERPVVVNGQIVIRPIMYLALSYDHRIVDGKESVSFLVRVKQLLEDPIRLLLEV